MPGGLRVYNPYIVPPLLLDIYTGAAAAYSLRKLRTAYTGAAIRVRESGGNTEADIGFSGNDLDTAALTTLVGANTGYTPSWYDQIGSSTVTKATSTQQPVVSSNGKYLGFTAASSTALSCASNSSLQLGTDDFWLASWFYLASTTSYQTVVYKSNEGAPATREYLLQLGIGWLEFTVYYGSSSRTVSSGATPPQNAWNFVFIWYDTVAQTLNMQLNNNSVRSVAHSSGVNTLTNSFQIGSRLTGRVSDVYLGKPTNSWLNANSSTLRNVLYGFGAPE